MNVQQKSLFAFLTVFLLWGVTIALLTPPGNFPDEQGHLQYVRHVRLSHELPKLSYNPAEISSTIAFHPPLYYLCAAALFQPSWPQGFQVFILRFFSILQGLVTVFLLWKCAYLIFADNHAAVILAMAVSVFNPQFIFIHSGIGNIPMTSATCALAALYITKIMVAPDNLARKSLLLGIAIGLAVLSRSFTVYLVVPALFAVFFRSKDRKSLLKHVLLLTLAAAATGGWWYIRNWIQYGDPLLWKIYSVTLGAEWIRKETGFQWTYFLETISFIYASFWAYFGRAEYHAGIWEYAVYLSIDLFAVIGIIRVSVKSQDDHAFQAPAFERSAFYLMLMTGLLAVIEIVLLMRNINAPQGRYLYMAIVPLSLARSAGLIKIFPPAFRMHGAIVGSAVFFLFGSYLLIRYWLPHV